MSAPLGLGVEQPVARATLQRFSLDVPPVMDKQRAFVAEPLPTLVTLKRLFPGVRPLVYDVLRYVLIFQAADGAGVALVGVLLCFVLSQCRSSAEHLTALLTGHHLLINTEIQVPLRLQVVSETPPVFQGYVAPQTPKCS